MRPIAPLLLVLMLLFVLPVIPAEQAVAPQLSISSGLLDNGIDFHVISGLPTTGIAIRYTAGSRFEPKGKEGLAHLVEHLSFMSAAGLARTEADDIVREYGAKVAGYTDWDYITIVWQAPADALDRILAFESARMKALNPTQDQLDLERKLLISEITATPADNPAVALGAAFAQYLDGTEYNRPISGTPNSLNSITLEDINAYAKANLAPRRAEIYIAGQVSRDTIETKLKSVFSPIMSDVSDIVPVLLKVPEDAHLLINSESNSGVFAVYLKGDAAEAEAGRLAGKVLCDISSSPFANATKEGNPVFKTLRYAEIFAGGRDFATISFSTPQGISPKDAWIAAVNGLQSAGAAKLTRSVNAACALARTDTLAEQGRAFELLRMIADVPDFSTAQSIRDFRLNALGDVSRAAVSKAVAKYTGFVAIRMLTAPVAASDTVKLGESKGIEFRPSAFGYYAFDKCAGVTTFRGPVAGLESFALSFPASRMLPAAEAEFLSESLFYSPTIPGGTTACFEDLGWRFEVNANGWAFWGLEETSDKAASFAFSLIEPANAKDALIANMDNYLIISDGPALLRMRLLQLSDDQKLKDEDPEPSAYFLARTAIFACSAVQRPRYLRIFAEKIGRRLDEPPKALKYDVRAIPQCNDLSFRAEPGFGLAIVGPVISGEEVPAFAAVCSYLGLGYAPAGRLISAARGEPSFCYNTFGELAVARGRMVYLLTCSGSNLDAAGTRRTVLEALFTLADGITDAKAAQIADGYRRSLIAQTSDAMGFVTLPAASGASAIPDLSVLTNDEAGLSVKKITAIFEKYLSGKQGITTIIMCRD